MSRFFCQQEVDSLKAKKIIRTDKELIEKYRTITFFKGTQFQIKDGSIRYIPKINIAYIKPHHIKFLNDNNTYLIFGRTKSNKIFKNSLYNPVELKDLEKNKNSCKIRRSDN